MVRSNEYICAHFSVPQSVMNADDSDEDDTDHGKRVSRSKSVRISSKQKTKHGYCVTVKDQRGHAQKVLMRKEQRRPQNMRVRSRARREPVFITVLNQKRRIYDPKNSLEQLSSMPIVKTNVYRSVSCTCPDWNYRGVYHENDRSTSKADFNLLPSNRKIGVLRAVDGCKHMILANEVCAND